MKNKGKLVVIVAPSGAGKSTLIKRLKVDFPQLEESVSFTTRGPREGEVHGTHYFFLSIPEFKEMIEKNEFIEWAMVHENYYGTSKPFVQGKLDEGTSILFDIDVQGADNIKKIFGDEAQTIFIAPPSIDVLEQRLRGRGTEKEETIQVRIKNAREELKRQNDYDHCVINDDLDKAHENLKEVFQAILEG